MCGQTVLMFQYIIDLWHDFAKLCTDIQTQAQCGRNTASGFKPIGEEWPSMYYHEAMKLLFVVYGDDLKLAGPTENMSKG